LLRRDTVGGHVGLEGQGHAIRLLLWMLLLLLLKHLPLLLQKYLSLLHLLMLCKHGGVH
jgi:hypothetical protein